MAASRSSTSVVAFAGHPHPGVDLARHQHERPAGGAHGGAATPWLSWPGGTPARRGRRPDRIAGRQSARRVGRAQVGEHIGGGHACRLAAAAPNGPVRWAGPGRSGGDCWQNLCSGDPPVADLADHLARAAAPAWRAHELGPGATIQERSSPGWGRGGRVPDRRVAVSAGQRRWPDVRGRQRRRASRRRQGPRSSGQPVRGVEGVAVAAFAVGAERAFIGIGRFGPEASAWPPPTR
jgi:hypothetical protein